MAKVYLLTQDDIDLLTTMVDRNPEHGHSGGTSNHSDERQREANREAHGFYNYQVRTWIAKVTR